MKLNIENVISARLKLQSTQKAMVEKFGVQIPSCYYLKKLTQGFKQWDENKQKEFVILLGGKTNIRHTFEYLKNLN